MVSYVMGIGCVGEILNTKVKVCREKANLTES